jgi:hypothetical protein
MQGGTSAEYYHLKDVEHKATTRLFTQEYSQPATGFNSTIANTTGTFIIDPSGTLATGTITMPETPVSGQKVTIVSTGIVTTLTHSGNTGQTLISPLTTIAANGYATWEYKSSNTTWYRIN